MKLSKIQVCCLLSLAVHISAIGYGSFSAPQTQPPQKNREQEITFKITPPEYLPQVYKITEEKKITKAPAPEKPKQPPKPKPPKQPPEPKQAVEENVKSVPKPPPPPCPCKVDEERQKSMLRYQDSIKQKIQSNKKYPRWALRAKHQGSTSVIFSVLPSGAIKNLQLARPSGFKELDREALAAVQRSTPFSAFPEMLKEKEIRIKIDIVFSINPGK